MTAALICSGISKALGGHVVLKGLDLDVAAGEVVSLLGASGSGKTTLLRIIAGLHDPDGGTMTLDGRIVWGAEAIVPAEKRRIGMVFQDYALWPHMTVTRNLAFGLKAQGVAASEIRRRIDHALEVARLEPLRDRYPSELSGGQQQRVAIARCLAARPALMLFDEPLSNLDAALREDMRVEMMDLVRQEGITVIYVTHDQAEAMAVSDRIAVMREGTIAQFDTPQRSTTRRPIPLWPASSAASPWSAGSRRQWPFHIAGDGGQAIEAGRPRAGEGILVIRPEDARPASAYPKRPSAWDRRVAGLPGAMLAPVRQPRRASCSASIGRRASPSAPSSNFPFRPSVVSSLPRERCGVIVGSRNRNRA